MKKSLRILSLVLIFMMLLPLLPAYAEGERVEITFAVGDDTLMINGQAVTVEKPYVVGAGVTLVPLRVITEAFGAQVDWEGTTKTITLTYPDVNIVLQIDNPIAEVNGKAETLLSAPELTGNGFTMVPLRFISETFGATVTYDDATRAITVVKEGSTSGDIVQGGITAPVIGDSYYKWSMNRPTEMELSYRDFDGTHTSFAYDENNYVDILILLVEEDYDFARDYAEWKSSFDGLSLVKADKNEVKKTMHFQAKDKTVFYDLWLYNVGDFNYIVMGKFENAQTKVLEDSVAAMESFTCNFPQGTYDLSNVKNGMRMFQAEELNLSVNIPADFYLASDEDAINEFTFYCMDREDYISSINIAVYSKSSVGSAKELAEKDYTFNKRQLNEKLVNFPTGVEEKMYGVSAYEYTTDATLSTGKEHSRDVFFEKGEYVYNIRVTLPQSNTADMTIDTIIGSVIALEIDPDRVGVLMRNDTVDEGSYTSKGSNYSLTVPNSYSEVSMSGATAYQSKSSGATLALQVQYANNTNYSDASNFLKEIEKELRQTKGVTITKSTSPVTIGGIRYAEVQYTEEADGIKYYSRYLVGVYNNKVIMWVISLPEMTYSNYNIKEVEGIVNSIKLD